MLILLAIFIILIIYRFIPAFNHKSWDNALNRELSRYTQIKLWPNTDRANKIRLIRTLLAITAQRAKQQKEEDRSWKH
jgi:hypothetical protein